MTGMGGMGAKGKGRIMRKAAVVLIGLAICGCAGREASQPQVVRQRFMAGEKADAPRGASWTKLVPAPGRPGAMWVRAHAGVGDKFPVQDEAGQTHFDVAVIDGNDDRLTLQAGSVDDAVRFDVYRDKLVVVRLRERMYEFHYPSVGVSSAAPAATDKALIMVTRLP